jgi:autotransporter-associated beta strand protein
MKKLFLPFFFALAIILVLSNTVCAQQDVYWRNDAATNNWWDGNNPWYRNCDSWWIARPDYNTCNNATTIGGNYLHFDNNNRTTMSVNGAWFKIYTLTFESTATSARTLTADGSGGLSFTAASSYLTNLSNATHVLTTGIGIDGAILIINASAGSFTFNNPIYINANALTFTGSNNNTVNGILSGSGTLTKLGSGTLFLNSAQSYTGTTTVSNGILEIQDDMSSSLITVENGATLRINGSGVDVNALTINSGGIVEILSGKSLTVSGTLTNNATATGLVVKSGGSLITGSAVSATAERSIDARTPPYAGWHFISSPVSAQTFQSSFVSNPPSANEDFYLWSETTNEWVNSKSGTSPDFTFNSAAFTSNFIVGQGYLAAYSALSTKSFSGTLNVADVPKTLTYTGTSGRKGWNLLGNPFTSGIKWNVITWGASNVAGVAKIIKSSDGSYQDISADGYIPALNGFLVRTTVNSQSITIPASAKEHNGSWYKSDEIKQFALTVRDIEGATAQSSNIRINPEATNDFDFLYDGEFVALYAPQFYSIAGENKLSTNSLPEITNETVINFGFVKNDGSQFKIEAEDMEEFGGIAYLTDLKTGTVQNLNSNPVYSFTSVAGDQPNRFKLSFESVGIEDVKEVTPGIYTYGNKLCIENSGQATLEVYNMAGQRILVQEINSNGLYQTTLNNQTGYYVVRLTNAGQVKVSKVFIK